MKKVMMLLAAFAFIACGTNPKTEKQSTSKETKTETKGAAAEHNHAEGEACEHDHAEGEACEHDHAEGEACEHDHAAGEACEHDHAEGETCGHDHAAEGAAAEHNHAEGEACGEEGHVHPDPNFVEVELKESQAKQAKIKTYLVAPTTFSSVIKTTGKVTSNQTDRKVVVAPSSGIVRITSSNLADGASVQKGKSVLSISSSKIEGGDIFKKCEARYLAAESSYTRANTLIKDKLISLTDYNTIKLEYSNAKAEYEAVRGGGNGVNVASPINGYVNELLVKDGEYVQAGSPVMIVSAGTKSQLKAFVSERYYGRLKTISGANFKTSYNNAIYDINELGGKMLAYGKGENDESYLVPVTFEFNGNADILPGSYVEVYLKEKPRADVIVIPLSAITEEQNVYYVYTHRGGQLYRKNEVKLGDNDGKFVEVLSGIKAGDKVVSNGTYQIKLASSSGAIPAACGHQH